MTYSVNPAQISFGTGLMLRNSNLDGNLKLMIQTEVLNLLFKVCTCTKETFSALKCRINATTATAFRRAETQVAPTSVLFVSQPPISKRLLMRGILRIKDQGWSEKTL